MSEPKFEEALKRLEKIVEEMEGGELSLDDSLKKYEEGVKLSRLCLKKLEEAEKKIEILQKGLDGKVSKKPFKSVAEADESGGAEKKKGSGEEFAF